jgi:hypothetical protein
MKSHPPVPQQLKLNKPFELFDLFAAFVACPGARFDLPVNPGPLLPLSGRCGFVSEHDPAADGPLSRSRSSGPPVCGGFTRDAVDRFQINLADADQGHHVDLVEIDRRRDEQSW